MRNIIKALIAGSAILAITVMTTTDADAHGRKRVFFKRGFKVVKIVRCDPYTGDKIVKTIRTHLRSGKRVKIVRRIDPWGNVRIIRKTLRPSYGHYRHHPHKTRGWRRAARWRW